MDVWRCPSQWTMQHAWFKCKVCPKRKWSQRGGFMSAQGNWGPSSQHTQSIWCFRTMWPLIGANCQSQGHSWGLTRVSKKVETRTHLVLLTWVLCLNIFTQVLPLRPSRVSDCWRPVCHDLPKKVNKPAHVVVLETNSAGIINRSRLIVTAYQIDGPQTSRNTCYSIM